MSKLIYFENCLGFQVSLPYNYALKLKLSAIWWLFFQSCTISSILSFPIEVFRFFKPREGTSISRSVWKVLSIYTNIWKSKCLKVAVYFPYTYQASGSSFVCLSFCLSQFLKLSTLTARDTLNVSLVHVFAVMRITCSSITCSSMSFFG